jgi:hypothetical protein
MEAVMSIGFIFWLIYGLCIVFWGFGIYRPQEAVYWQRGGFILFVLLGLLGFGVFGDPIHR